jgi:hypothetical protein
MKNSSAIYVSSLSLSFPIPLPSLSLSLPSIPFYSHPFSFSSPTFYHPSLPLPPYVLFVTLPLPTLSSSLLPPSLFLLSLTTSHFYFYFYFFEGMNNIEQRRKFFEEFAKTNNFNSQIPENWYNQSRKKILQTKV